MPGDLRVAALLGEQRAELQGLVVAAFADHVPEDALASGQDRLGIGGAGPLPLRDERAEPRDGLVGPASVAVVDRGDERGQGEDVDFAGRSGQIAVGGRGRLGDQTAGDRAEEEVAVGRLGLGAGLRGGHRVEIREPSALDVGGLPVVVGVQFLDRSGRRRRFRGLLGDRHGCERREQRGEGQDGRKASSGGRHGRVLGRESGDPRRPARSRKGPPIVRGGRPGCKADVGSEKWRNHVQNCDSISILATVCSAFR